MVFFTKEVDDLGFASTLVQYDAVKMETINTITETYCSSDCTFPDAAAGVAIFQCNRSYIACPIQDRIFM